MSINITFLGQSGFVLKSDSHVVVIDPYLTDNPLATMKPGDIQCGTIVLTHGHGDHLGDTVAIAKANDATVYASFELANYLVEQDCKAELGNPGGQIETEFGFIAFTQAVHSSSYEGRYMGAACGVVVSIGGVRFYHLGDTALFSDLRLIGELYQPDVAAVPIGDRFTMGPQHATMAAEWIKPKMAIPVHYKTFPLLVQSADGFRPGGMKVQVMEPGQTIEFGE